MLHLSRAEPPTEHVDAERLSPDRFADVLSLAHANTRAASTTGPSQVDSAGDVSSDPPDPEPAFDGLPSESWQTDLVQEDLGQEDLVQEDLVEEDVDLEVPEDLVELDVDLEVPEDLVPVDLVPEDLEDAVPGVPDDVVPVDVVPEILAPQVGRHRRPTFVERAARLSRRRLSMVVLSVIVMVATVLGVLLALF